MSRPPRPLAPVPLRLFRPCAVEWVPGGDGLHRRIVSATRVGRGVLKLFLVELNCGHIITMPRGSRPSRGKVVGCPRCR